MSTEEKTPSGPVIYSLGDALKIADLPLPWIVDGLLLAGTMNLITAEPKAGKSTLVRTLCNAVATGGEFLGRQTTKGLCVYLTLEDMLPAVAKEFKKMGTPEDSDIWLVNRVGTTFDASMKWLYDLVSVHKPKLVVIDTFIRFTCIDNINDYARVVACLEPFFAMLHDNPETCLVFCHHDRKPREFGGGGPDRIMGSYGLFGEATTLINIRRNWRTNARTVQTWQRVGTDLDKHRLLLNPDTGVVSLGFNHVAQQRSDMSDTMHMIIDRMKELGELKWHESGTITDGLGDKRRLYEALGEMAETGMLLRCGRGVRMDPYKFALPNEVTHGEVKAKAKSKRGKADRGGKRVSKPKGGGRGVPHNGNGGAGHNKHKRGRFVPVSRPKDGTQSGQKAKESS